MEHQDHITNTPTHPEDPQDKPSSGEEYSFNEKLSDLLKDNKYSETFREKLSSPGQFRQTAEMLEQAFEQRNVEQFRNRLNPSRQHRRLLRILTTVAAMAAIIVTTTLMFLPIREANLPLSLHSVTADSLPATSPMLIVNNTTFVIDSSTKKILAQNYSLPADPQGTTEKVSLNHLLVPSSYICTIQLCDGTEVTLNAGSQLSYPSRFGTTREVTLKGEGYFKVAKNKTPFIVHSDSTYVKVYGTEFILNTRASEYIYTVLVEGSVGTGDKTSGQEIALKPNQISIFNTQSHQYTVKPADINQFIGWKEGYFRYENRLLSAFLAEISAWYGVKIDYDSQTIGRKRITLSMKRPGHIEEVGKFIESIIKVKFINTKGGYQIEKADY